MKLDNLHYNGTKLESHNKTYNVVISARAGGKSTWLWLSKIYKAWKKDGSIALVIRRRIVDITNEYIESCANTLRKFDVDCNFKYTSVKNGTCIVQISTTKRYNEEKMTYEWFDYSPFVMFLGLSVDISRVKSLNLGEGNPSMIVFDEFICNVRAGESYLKDEAFRLREIYSTMVREHPGLKIYLCGNPYSVYSPVLIDLGVPLDQMKKGVILVGDIWAVECYDLLPELKEKLLKENPLLLRDDPYTKYAFGGESMNDSNIRVCAKQPDHYQLSNVFYMDGKYLGVFINTRYKGVDDDVFWVSTIEYTGARRKVFCFDVAELIQGTVLFSVNERKAFQCLKSSFRRRTIQYGSIESYYLMEAIFTSI